MTSDTELAQFSLAMELLLEDGFEGTAGVAKDARNEYPQGLAWKTPCLCHQREQVDRKRKDERNLQREYCFTPASSPDFSLFRVLLHSGADRIMHHLPVPASLNERRLHLAGCRSGAILYTVPGIRNRIDFFLDTDFYKKSNTIIELIQDYCIFQKYTAGAKNAICPSAYGS